MPDLQMHVGHAALEVTTRFDGAVLAWMDKFQILFRYQHLDFDI